MNYETAARIRHLYVDGGFSVRALNSMFGYTNTTNVVRNRVWVDPDYAPPPKKRSGLPRLTLEAYGEVKTAKAWSTDSRCEVAYSTLRKRLAEGQAGPEVLKKRGNAGRSRSNPDPGRK